jgi:hypothetical protein
MMDRQAERRKRENAAKIRQLGRTASLELANNKPQRGQRFTNSNMGESTPA